MRKFSSVVVLSLIAFCVFASYPLQKTFAFRREGMDYYDYGQVDIQAKNEYIALANGLINSKFYASETWPVTQFMNYPLYPSIPPQYIKSYPLDYIEPVPLYQAFSDSSVYYPIIPIAPPSFAFLAYPVVPIYTSFPRFSFSQF